MSNKSFLILKIYQSFILTVIAIFLGLIFFKTPFSYTRENLKSGRVERNQIPLVKVVGTVDVSGNVEVENTVAAKIER